MISQNELDLGRGPKICTWVSSASHGFRRWMLRCNEFDRHPKKNLKKMRAVKHQKNYMKAWLHDGWFWDQAAAFILLTGFFSPFFFHPKNFMTKTGGKWQRDLRPARFALCRTSGSRLEGGGGKSSFYWPKINGDFSGVIKLPILGGSNNTNLW